MDLHSIFGSSYVILLVFLLFFFIWGKESKEKIKVIIISDSIFFISFGFMLVIDKNIYFLISIIDKVLLNDI